MNDAEKIKYIISVLNELLQSSKNIGELETYPNDEDANEVYVAVHINTTGKTLKINLNELLTIVGSEIVPHTHNYDEVDGIGDFKTIILEDINDLEWAVQRKISDITDDSFKTDDFVRGFTDVGKTSYKEGYILIDGFVMPTDLSDENKFFQTNSKIKA